MGWGQWCGVPLPVTCVLHSGVPSAGVVVVVDGLAINSVEGGWLMALFQVDDEDLIDCLCNQNFSL